MRMLRQMTEEEFQLYLSNAIKGYAQEKVEAGNWIEDEALENAKSEYDILLPEGVNTKNNYLFSIISETGEVVGMVWICNKGNQSFFIYDISINETQQGKGYGSQAMKEIEVFARELGANKIGLHVFGHNKRAIKLYEKLGYEPTNIKMSKTLV